MSEKNETNQIKLRDCEVNKKYVTLHGKAIRIVSKDTRGARVELVGMIEGMFLEYLEDNLVLDANDDDKAVSVSKCIIGAEYLDDYGARLRVIRKDKQSLRVVDVVTGDERDLEFKSDYYVRDPQRKTAYLSDKDVEIAELKERVRVLEAQIEQIGLLENADMEEVFEVVPEEDTRSETDYDDDGVPAGVLYSEDQTPPTDVDAMQRNDDDVPTPALKVKKVPGRRGRKPSKLPKQEKVVKRARRVKQKVVEAVPKKEVKTKKKRAGKRLDSKKQFVLDLLRQGDQTRESLAKAFIAAKLSKHTDVGKVKGYVSVMIHDLETKGGIEIQRIGSGKYQVI